MFEPQKPQLDRSQPALGALARCALALAALLPLVGCMQQSPMVALGLQPAIKAQSHTRLRFPAHTPVLMRFDASQAPEAWAVAAHQGVALHFPKAQRQQTATHGLEWFVRWPYTPQPEEAEALPTPPAVATKTLHLAAAEGDPEPNGKWYSFAGAKQKLGGLAKRIPSPMFWRRDVEHRSPREPLPPRVRGLAQVVVSDRNNGKILALADVQIDQSLLLQIASEPRDQINPAQRHASNERQIAKAFAALASSLVASGDS